MLITLPPDAVAGGSSSAQVQALICFRTRTRSASVAAVPVLVGDTEVTLADRVLVQEHVIYPAALDAFASGRAVVHPPATAALVNPLPV